MVAWTLVFHIIGLVFWLGSLLVVTRVLAMHAEETSGEARAALTRVEKRLFQGFAHPGAALMVITGIILVSQDPYYLRQPWLHAKLLLVLILVVLDLRVYFRAVAFQSGKIQMSRGECMGMHGAIALVFVGILILVLTKPFSMPARRTTQQEPRASAPASATAIVASISGRGRRSPPGSLQAPTAATAN